MDSQTKILLVGVGGYGQIYLDALLDCGDDRRKTFSFVGAVDPMPQGCTRYMEMKEKGIPFYNSLEAFYAQSSADLVIIASPIQYHCSQALLALSHGSHVLCEKPLSASAADGRRMAEAQRQAGKILAIGYQWSYSRAIQDLKRDLLHGLYGKPIRCKAIVLWPRPYDYFARNKWAGRKRDDAGNPVWDSVANNATAHYLHNLLFLLGSRMESSACPLSVSAELYRANNIENFDTCVVKGHLENGTELLYYASHAVMESRDPTFYLEFEKGEVQFGKDTSGRITGHLQGGTILSYGSPDEANTNKLWAVLDAVRTGSRVPCTAETALPHTLCIDGIQQSIPDIPCFPDSILKEYTLMPGEREGIYAEGLFEVLEDCYDKWTTPCDSGLAWAKAGKEIWLNGCKD